MRVERPGSSLSRDPEYWDRLARRVVEDGNDVLAGYGATVSVPDGWTEILAGRATWFVAASAAAMIVLWLSLPPRASVAYRWIERSLSPDEVAGTLIASPSPPAVELLMVQFPPAPESEEQG